MCTTCQALPLILSQKLVVSKFNYKVLAIRYAGDEWFFTMEYFGITQPGDTYWLTPGIHICGTCLRRTIQNQSIDWRPHDYGSDYIKIGNHLLDKALKLKAFL